MNKNFESSAIKPFILCGGSGTRLWPLSRESFPKQFVPLINGKSLLELTFERVSEFGAVNFVANEEHRFFVEELLNRSDLYPKGAHGSILLEPVGRNTAAAIACAAQMPNIDEADLLLFLPSDHFIPDTNEFISCIKRGILAANQGYIVTFGIQPTHPSTAYGYIKRKSSSNPTYSIGDIYPVENFIEKPSIDIAQKFFLAGDFFWNAGIFLCKKSVLIEALSSFAKDILDSSKKAMSSSLVDGHFIRPVKDHFLTIRAESIDYAVMEKSNNIAVTPFNGIWSDVGSWNALADLYPSDKFGNRVNGKGLAFCSNNTYIDAPHRHVISLGVSNLFIVDTQDAVLVASGDNVEMVKDLVADLKDKGISEAVTNRKVPRPWGWYDSIDSGDGFQVKHITVKPGASLSLQMHNHRAEHWVVVKGMAKVINGDDVLFLEKNQSTYIPIGVRHRLENIGLIDLEIIEVQSGDYLGEDDIIRFEDVYGRVTTVSQ